MSFKDGIEGDLNRDVTKIKGSILLTLASAAVGATCGATQSILSGKEKQILETDFGRF